MSTLDERIKKLGGSPHQNINSGGKPVAIVKVDGRKNNRGFVGKAGRKPKTANLLANNVLAQQARARLDAYYHGSVTVQVQDPKTRMIRIEQKDRIIVALEKLWNLAMKGDGDADAINKWLDRALGKPVQAVTNEGDVPIFQLQFNIANILNKAYGKRDARRD